MNINNRAKKAGAFLITLFTVIIIIFGLFGAKMLETSEAQRSFPNEHLFIDATYLLKTAETNDTVNVTCDLYLTNIWEKESGEIKIIAYVIETSDNLAIDKNKVEIGKVSFNSTAEIEVPVILSNNSYKVDILIFESGKLVLKGTIYISAYPIYYWDAVNHTSVQLWKLENKGTDFVQIH